MREGQPGEPFSGYHERRPISWTVLEDNIKEGQPRGPFSGHHERRPTLETNLGKLSEG
jgi:hypothetical protein